MAQGTTVAELFELAIGLERTAETLYRGLAAKFPSYDDVVAFWEQYAVEEAGHALWLQRLRDELDADKLVAVADPSMVKYAVSVLNLSVETSLARVRNLEDAYQLVNDVESSETNAVFDFLVTNFAYSKEVLSFLQRQLESHVARLMDEFPARFQSRRARMAVVVQNSD